MKVAIFGSKPYVKDFFNDANKEFNHELKYFKPNLNSETAMLTRGFDSACVFVNDTLDAGVLDILAENNLRLVALRCAGFNNVDIAHAEGHKIKVVRVPAYSPNSVAEHTVALMLTLNRKTYRAYNRVREGNFLLDGLMGFDLVNKYAGIVGTGKIGAITAKILLGFGCKILAYDKYQSEELIGLGVKYTSLDELYENSDIISLHCPLTPETFHLIDDEAISKFKEGVMLINTSRGKLINSQNVTEGLKSGKIGYLGLDVYEEEADLFFEDLSERVIQDDIFARLLTFPNVVITGHQAFFTREAMSNIAYTTLKNISDIERNGKSENEVTSKFLHS
jgi:D-lactate dehydrogenase